MQTTRGAPLKAAGNGKARATRVPRAGTGVVTAQGAGSSSRRGLLLALVGAVVLIIDVVTKMIAVTELAHRPPVRLLGGLLTLRYVRNPGAAFGLGPNLTIVFSMVSIGVVVGICYAAWRVRSLPWAITLGLLLGGATGNLGDRLFRDPGPFRGHVVDWIQLPYWPVFNAADTAIVCGGVLAVLLAGRGVRLDGSRTDSEDTPAATSGPSGSAGSRKSGDPTGTDTTDGPGTTGTTDRQP